MSLKGSAELLEALKDLEVKTRNQYTNKATREAAKISVVAIKAEMISQGLVKTGAMTRGVSQGKRRERVKGLTTYVLGVRADDSYSKKLLKTNRTKAQIKRNDDPFYWRFLELGTKFIPAKNIIQNVFKSKQSEMLEKLTTSLRASIFK